MNQNNLLLIIAGTNGAGKSTAYENLKDISNLYNDITFINPDVITKQTAQSLGYGSVNNLPKELQRIINIQAGKQALRIRKGQSKKIETFCICYSIAISSKDVHNDNGYNQYPM